MVPASQEIVLIAFGYRFGDWSTPGVHPLSCPPMAGQAPFQEVQKVHSEFPGPDDFGLPKLVNMFSEVVVSNIFYVHPYLGKCSNLTNIF